MTAGSAQQMGFSVKSKELPGLELRSANFPERQQLENFPIRQLAQCVKELLPHLCRVSSLLRDEIASDSESVLRTAGNCGLVSFVLAHLLRAKGFSAETVTRSEVIIPSRFIMGDGARCAGHDFLRIPLRGPSNEALFAIVDATYSQYFSFYQGLHPIFICHHHKLRTAVKRIVNSCRRKKCTGKPLLAPFIQKEAVRCYGDIWDWNVNTVAIWKSPALADHRPHIQRQLSRYLSEHGLLHPALQFGSPLPPPPG